MEGTTLLAAGALILSAAGWFESFAHRRNLRRIPIRIHVNGTRGKSSVTRLIAAGLRAGGIRTCAKTTGTLPRMIFPDGSEFPVFRTVRANVIEQVRIVKAAVAAQAEALVLECMALQPALQSLCELQLVRATHGVITNARPDHLDVMGPTVSDVAKALAGTVPVGEKLFTSDTDNLSCFASAARDRNCRLIAVGDDETGAITWDELQQFPHIEHPENIALALAVCTDLGVDRSTALRGMWSATPDPGVMAMYHVKESNHQMTFVNGFAANDPESTGKNWNMVVDRFPNVERRIALFNCRADRPDRSIQLAEACVRWKPADHYVLIGTATDVFYRRALARGLKKHRLTCATRSDTPALIETLTQRAGRSSMVMGMGNISGPGLDVIDYFQRRQAEKPTEISMLRKAA